MIILKPLLTQPTKLLQRVAIFHLNVLFNNKFMINLDSCPSDLTQSKKFQVSKLFYSSTSMPFQARSKSVEFLPFLQQRDKLGRLLPSPSTEPNTGRPSLLAESRLFGQQPHLQQYVAEMKVNRAVESFFRKIDMESKQMSRSQFVPKKIIINTERTKAPNPYSNCEYDISSGLDQIKLKNRTISIRQQKVQSPIKRMASLAPLQSKNSLNNTTTSNLFNEIKSPLLQKRSISQHIVSNQQKQSPTKRQQPYKQHAHKKSQSLIGSLKVKLNPEQPDYKRYKQQQECSLKIFQDYEEGHEKFREKMKQSKLIAYNIKKQLQLD